MRRRACTCLYPGERPLRELPLSVLSQATPARWTNTVERGERSVQQRPREAATDANHRAATKQKLRDSRRRATTAAASSPAPPGAAGSEAKSYFRLARERREAEKRQSRETAGGMSKAEADAEFDRRLWQEAEVRAPLP